MPGIFGIVSKDPNITLEQRLQRGVGRLLRQPWHFAETHLASCLGIASIQREGSLSGGDLWVSPEDDIVVAIDGELYQAPSITEPNGAEHVLRYPTSCCAAHIGALFRQKHEKWVETVRGAFAVAILDREQEKFWLFTDRYGLRPIAYTHIGCSFITASAMAAFTAAWPEAEWGLDWDAVADWFAFQHVLGEKSFLKTVRLLPNAGRLCYRLDTGEINLDQYWTFSQVPSLSHIAFDEAVEEACRLFGLSVEEQAAGGHRLGVYLTSGLDSRTIVGYLSSRNLEFCTATYGICGCRDMVWGTALAQKVKSAHHLFPMENGSWLSRYSDEFLKVGESFVSCFHAHGINTYNAMRSEIDVHLSGIGGGSFAGGDTTTVGALRATTDQGRMEALYEEYLVSLGNVFRYPLERMNLFQPKAWMELRERAEASFNQDYMRYAHLRHDIIGDAFTLNNRYKKMFAYMIAAERDYFENRLPFMDYHFLDFIFSIPTTFRLERRLQIGMLDSAVPELTTVPWQVTAGPPRLHHRRLSRYAWILRVLLSKLLPNRQVPFEPGRNYPLWLREDALNWATEILDSDEVEERGVLNRAYLQDLLDRVKGSANLPYQEQRNLTYRIGVALSFEWMCRRVLDVRGGTDE